MKWPIFGFFPSLVSNLHRFHDFIALDILASSQYTFQACIASMSFFMTCDPANVQHIFTSNHANYPKGEEFADIFDVVRGSLFTIDGEPCRRHRANGQSVLSNPRLLASMTKCCRDKVENGLLPIMAHMARTDTPVDISDLMVRLVFDLYATTIFGVDPGCLSFDMPPVNVADAMDTVMEVGMIRHMLPPFCWKTMRHLKIGPERKLAAAQDVLRSFTTKMVERRKKTGHPIGLEEEEMAATTSMDVLSYYVNHPDYNNDYLLQVTLISYMIAGRDAISTSLPWVFYNLAKNPHVISSIRDELAPIVSRKAAIASRMTIFEPEDVKPLVYLQATLLESLRLYPPVPMERKSVVATDVMPSGHEVSPGDCWLTAAVSESFS
jgi:cytochrome P450